MGKVEDRGRYAPMKFFKVIYEMLSLGLNEFAAKLGVSGQNLSNWILGKTPKVEQFLMALVRARKLSGLSWTKFGAILDAWMDERDRK